MLSRFIICCTIFILSICLLYAGPSRIEKISIYNTALGIEKNFRIYLPEGYDESDDKYPSVYLFHPFPKGWIRDGNIETLADSLISSGEMGKMILVMPGLTFEGDLPCGFPVNMINRNIYVDPSGLGTGQFEDYMIVM
jgi:hypothetical protein